MPIPAEEAADLSNIEAPPELKPADNEPLLLHMTEDSKVVYETVGKAAGINVLFDPDYRSTRIEVDLNNVSLLDALRIVGVMSNTFWRPVTSNTIFVAQNSPSKRRDMDEQAVQTFYLTNAWQQNDLNDVATAIRNVMPIGQGLPGAEPECHRHARHSRRAAAGAAADRRPRQGARRSGGRHRGARSEQELGERRWASPGPAASASLCSRRAHRATTAHASSSSDYAARPTTTTTSPTLYNLAHLNSTNFAVTVGSATLNLLLTDNNTKILQSPRIRATDAQKATMKIGSNIPIATGSTNRRRHGAGQLAGQHAVPVSGRRRQYRDDAQRPLRPRRHAEDQDRGLRGERPDTISGVTEPIISQRVVDQVIRLREGEASILGGIQDKQESVNWNGIPGLSAIPDPQVHLRLQRSHHPGRRHRLRGGAAYRALAGAGPGESARHRHRRRPDSIDLRHADNGIRRRRRPQCRGAPSRVRAPSRRIHSRAERD